MSKSDGVFTSGTKRNVDLKHIAADHKVAKVASQDLNLLDDTQKDGYPFAAGPKKVLKREIACSDQDEASSAERPVPAKDDVRKQLNDTTWTPGTKKEEERQIDSGEQKRIKTKGSNLFSDTSDMHEHRDVESNVSQNEF